MMELKNYQNKYTEELKEKVNKLLKYDENKVCVFDAPTGSGKTIMMAEFLKRLVLHRDDGKKLAFIWISVRQLHGQSKEKLERYFKDTRVIQCSEFEDLNDRRIGENEVLFFNWESINKADNIYIRENEQDNNLTEVVANTKEDGREIILIIDESHHTATSEKSIEIIEKMIAPKVTIEVSATPLLTSKTDELVKVPFEEVITEGMIKKEVAINPEIDKARVVSDSADELVIKCALKKRAELEDAYRKEGARINPLILIQLPDKRVGILDKKEDIINLLKNKFGITFENRKLAIWLSDSEDKVNLENIEKPDNEVEILMFKQAIALGWDCPRAAILVLFRDWKSLVFSIQTVGRIMRMPEFKHYEREALNKGYVFTNLAEIEIAQDLAKDYLTIYEATRQDKIYRNVDLSSIYLKRQRERTRLSGEFRKIFFDIAKKELIKPKINLKPKELMNEILVDGVIKKLDKVQVVEHEGEMSVRLSETELQYYFDMFARSACTPYAPTRSSEIIKNAIYKFFKEILKVNDEYKVQIITLSKENNQHVLDYLNAAKEEYKDKVVGTLNEQKEIIKSVWNVPRDVSYNSKYSKIDLKKSILQPFYARTQSKPEQDFVQLLEDPSNKVKWWYKNGESESKFFAVLYTGADGREHGFYTDFIFMMEDGRIGMFDTKEGRTAEDAKPKAEALAEYIRKENKRRGSEILFGGIVVFKDGSCRYNDGKVYSYDKKNLGDDWKFLNLK